MGQVAPHSAFPSGDSWVIGVLAAGPEELSGAYELEFEQAVGDLGPYRLAAIEDPTVGQLWLFRYDDAPYPGTEVLADTSVLRDDALFAMWSQLGLDVRGFDWLNQYNQYPRPELGPGAAEPPPRTLTGLASLTPREREVLGLLADGSTNAEIGSQLRVSGTTVTAHLRHISSKLGTGTVRRLRDTVARYPHQARTA